MSLLASFFSWWYGAGWRESVSRISFKLGRTSEFFSLKLLARTLFSPYRQISAGGVKGNLSVQWRAFIDRTVSRLVGFCVRFIVLLIGLVSIAGLSVASLVWLLVWPLVPLSPVIMIVLALRGLA